MYVDFPFSGRSCWQEFHNACVCVRARTWEGDVNVGMGCPSLSLHPWSSGGNKMAT